MANSPKITAATANSMLNATYGSGNLNGGFIQIYTGTQPANCGDAITAQVLLATLPLGSVAFGSASGGAITANPVGPAQAVATGTASWFRMLTTGNAVFLDGSVGTSGCDLNLTSTSITAGDTVAITSVAISVPLQ